MASLGYFTTMPRPDPRKLPELPPVTPWVPVVPKMPDLPEEIPWPPDFDFGDWPSPWYDGNDGRPYCYNDFASRLMRLITSVAAFRAAAGLRPMYPPFDLRFMVATPTLVSIAALWLTVMWNTAKFPSGEETWLRYDVVADHRDASIRRNSIYGPDAFYEYVSGPYGSYFAQRVGREYGGGAWECAFIYDGVTIPDGVSVKHANLESYPCRVTPPGLVDVIIRGSLSSPLSTDFGTFERVRSHVLAPTEHSASVVGTYADGQNVPIHEVDFAAVITEMMAKSWWSPGAANSLAITLTPGPSMTETSMYPYAAEKEHLL